MSRRTLRGPWVDPLAETSNNEAIHRSDNNARIEIKTTKLSASVFQRIKF